MFMQVGRTALMYASGKGEADTVRVLLDHGAVVDLKNNVRIINFCVVNNFLDLTAAVYTCHSMK